MSERWTCRLVNQPRGTRRYHLTQREDEDALTLAITDLAPQYERHAHRRIAALLKRGGWQVGKDLHEGNQGAGGKGSRMVPASPLSARRLPSMARPLPSGNSTAGLPPTGRQL
jgi:hypothetical protein